MAAPAFVQQVITDETTAAAVAKANSKYTDWGGGPNSPENVLAAGLTFNGGPNGKSYGGAPEPFQGESFEAYLDRVIYPGWQPGVPGGGLQALAEQAGGALTHDVLDAVAATADGFVPGAGSSIRNLDTQIQNGLKVDEAMLTAAGSGGDTGSEPNGIYPFYQLGEPIEYLRLYDGIFYPIWWTPHPNGPPTAPDAPNFILTANTAAKDSAALSHLPGQTVSTSGVAALDDAALMRLDPSTPTLLTKILSFLKGILS